jgi:hypothetical protein
MKLIKWHIYEISSSESVNGVMLRGRIRKLGIEEGFNLLAENTEDIPNRLRFAVIEKSDAEKVINYLRKILSDVDIQHVMDDVENPILSKMKVNIAERYKL